MKILIASLFLAFSAFSSTCGANYIGTRERLESFLEELNESVSNPQKFSEIFMIPMKLSFTDGTQINITKAWAFQTLHSQFMKAGFEDAITGMDQDKILCNYQGGMLNDIWFDALEENGKILIKAVNFKLQNIPELKKPKAQESIKPLSGREFHTFLDLLKDPANKIAAGLAGLSDLKKAEAKPILIGADEFMLYKADINNDRELEYILTYINSGSGKYSGIKAVLKVKRGILINHALPDFSKAGMRLGSPFLFKRKGKTYINFAQERSAHPYRQANKTFLWSGKNLELAKP